MTVEINDNVIKAISNLIDVDFREIKEAIESNQENEEEFEVNSYSFIELLPSLDYDSINKAERTVVLRRIVDIATGKE